MNEIEGQKDYHMIRPMMAKDTDCVLEMMQVFYASPAVFTNGSDNIFLSDIAQHFSERYRSLCRRQPVSGRIYF